MHTDSSLLAASAGLRVALGYYRLIAEIGRGGMASVFLSLFPNGDGTSRKVVLKQLHPELALDDDFRAMFEDEARVTTRLHHPNVVVTYDVYSDADQCVLVMEFLDGQTLSRFRQRAGKDGHVPLAIQLRIIADVLAGLHYVHELTDARGKPLGIVHRDVTPTNVFLTYDGQIKLLDFGIAKATTRVAVTRIGVLKGKLAYMSPEAARGEHVDRRSDVFSVGVMLWEAATGLRFWQDHDEIAIFRRLIAEDLPLDRAGAHISNPLLRQVAHRALATNPRQRYGDAKEMQQDLQKLLGPLGNLAQAPALSAAMDSTFALDRERLHRLIQAAQTRCPNQPASKRCLGVGETRDACAKIAQSDPPTEVFAGAASSSAALPDGVPRPTLPTSVRAASSVEPSTRPSNVRDKRAPEREDPWRI